MKETLKQRMEKMAMTHPDIQEVNKKIADKVIDHICAYDEIFNSHLEKALNDAVEVIEIVPDQGETPDGIMVAAALIMNCAKIIINATRPLDKSNREEIVTIVCEKIMAEANNE